MLSSLIDRLQLETGFSFSEKVTRKLAENDYSLCGYNVRSEIANHLNTQYPQYRVSEWGVSSDKFDTQAQETYLLTTVLAQPEGKKFLDLFIEIGGSELVKNLQQSGDTRIIKDLIVVAKTFSAYEKEFKRVLESEDSLTHSKVAAENS